MSEKCKFSQEHNMSEQARTLKYKKKKQGSINLQHGEKETRLVRYLLYLWVQIEGKRFQFKQNFEFRVP